MSDLTNLPKICHEESKVVLVIQTCRPLLWRGQSWMYQILQEVETGIQRTVFSAIGLFSFLLLPSH